MRILGAIASGAFSLVAQASFSNTIGLGSVIVAMLVVILFGAFSFKERRNSGWKDMWEQERALRESRDEQLESERVVRHDIKDELAQTKASLEIEKSKPDLTVILDRMQTLWSDQTTKTIEQLQAMQDTQVVILDLLRELKAAA